MINMVNEKERNQNIYIEKRNETNKMLDETLRIINDFQYFSWILFFTEMPFSTKNKVDTNEKYPIGSVCFVNFKWKVIFFSYLFFILIILFK